MTAGTCHNCHRPAVAVVVLQDGYSVGKCCWSTPQRAAEQPPRPQAVKPKQRQGQH